MEKHTFEKIETEDTIRAFAVSLGRFAAKDPSILLEVAKVAKSKDQALAWESLYHDLQDQECLTNFAIRSDELAKSYDWSNIEHAYYMWGLWGWITFDISKFKLWDNSPATQLEADRQVLKSFKKQDFLDCINYCKTYTHHVKVFDEAMVCFENKFYHACATLLISLIDGELISSHANSVLSNRKTGATAGSRLIKSVSKDETFGEPGLFHLELTNYNAFIDKLFERTDGFHTEPNNINRNFLHHGMSKRKVLRKDCIKLFLGYRKTLEYAQKTQE